MFSLVKIANAAGNINTLMKSISKFIINPLIVLLFAVALVIFLYGVIQFVIGKTSDDKRNEGKQHMLWGVIGLFIMISVFFLLNILMGTFNIQGINVKTGEVNIPF